jgi:hypothetical protein|tara:strand:+ start:607 stop:915 length:309 start_codon:yes stop_codon:yes gene_type:complete
MIRKTFKQNIELPITTAHTNNYLGSRMVKAEWTIDIRVICLNPYRDEVVDIDIVSCDADLDERQYDRLKEICIAMRHVGAFDMSIIDENDVVELLNNTVRTD